MGFCRVHGRVHHADSLDRHTDGSRYIGNNRPHLALMTSAVMQGRRNRGTSAAAPLTFGAEEQCSPDPCKFVDVTDWRWWLFAGGSHQHSFVSALYQINKTCRLLRRRWCCVPLLLSWSRRFVIQIYLSTPYCGQSTVASPVCYCVLMRTLAVSNRCIRWTRCKLGYGLRSTRTYTSSDWTCKESHNTSRWETWAPFSRLHSK